MAGIPLTVAELCAFCGVAQPTVSKWISKGLPAEKDDKGRFIVSSTAFLAWRSEQRALDPRIEKARLDKLRADTIERALERDKGQYLDIEAVGDLWVDIAVAARKRILGLATRLAPMVIGLKTMPEVKAVLDEQIYEALGPIDPDRLPIPGGSVQGRAPANGEPVGRRAKVAKRRDSGTGRAIQH